MAWTQDDGSGSGPHSCQSTMSAALSVASCRRPSNSWLRSLRAGASLRTAIEVVASDFPESGLSVVCDRMRGGLSIGEAIDIWAVGQ